MDIAFVCDIMLDLQGTNRPAAYLAYDLAKKGYEVSIFSPIISPDVEEHLRAIGITPVNLHATLFAKYSGFSLLWFELWAREAFFRLNSRCMLDRSCVTINFSHTFATPSTFWYVQGPTSAALQDGENELLGIYKLGYKILKSIIDYSDKELVKDTGKRSAYIIANSKFCASIYQKWGIKITDIIYPPLDCDVFRPRTSSPSSNYVLTYFGKETKFSVIKAVADMGVSIKAFGLKSPIVPRAIFTHPHIEFIGKVTTDKLVNLYSNALFTLFPFTHEPFGYVPVESMACGTPTLTYNTQGPSETIIDGYNGWLAESDETLVSKAQKFWREGYPLRLRSNCIKHALKFDKKFYTQKWLDILHRI